MIDNESGEEYLEAILRLSESGQDVHSVNVARELGVKPADLPMTTARAPARPVEMQVYAKEVR